MIEPETVEVLHIILEMICALISRAFFQILLNIFFSKFSYQKLNLLEPIGIFYRPPNENEFFNIFSTDFQQIDSKTNEIYLLGDFNINSKKISHINLKVPVLL